MAFGDGTCQCCCLALTWSDECSFGEIDLVGRFDDAWNAEWWFGDGETELDTTGSSGI